MQLKLKTADFEDGIGEAVRLPIRDVGGRLFKSTADIAIKTDDGTTSHVTNGYWWEMPPVDTKSMSRLAAKDATFKRLPMIGKVLTEENTKEDDTAVVLGTLNTDAMRAFNRDEPLHLVFSPKVKGAKGNFIYIPEQALAFLPAIAATVTTIRANLPHPDLWQHLDINIRISSGVIKPGEHGEAVQRDRHGKPRPSAWHNHMEGTKLPVINLPDIVMAGQVPTMFTDNHVATHDEEYAARLRKKGYAVIAPSREGAAHHAMKGWSTLLPGAVLMMGRTSAHKSSVYDGEEPVHRTFMRAFTRIDNPTTKTLLENPEIATALRDWTPDALYISGSLIPPHGAAQRR